MPFCFQLLKKATGKKATMHVDTGMPHEIHETLMKSDNKSAS